MARASASDQLTRLLALPAWVAENPGVTIKEAAEHFGVAPAVIERDVNTLWVSGLPGGMHGDLVDFDAADFEAGHLRLSEPLGLDRPVRLTRQEAISLLMALRVLADLLADDEAGLAHGLATLLGDDELLERIKAHNYEVVPVPEWGSVVQMNVEAYRRAIALAGSHRLRRRGLSR